MTKTELMLLLKTDGSPVMSSEQVAELREISPRTQLNQIYAKTSPIPMWKDGGKYFAHVSDVAKWIDKQRETAS